MNCTKCGEKLPENTLFCGKCGTPASQTNEKTDKTPKNSTPSVDVSNLKAVAATEVKQLANKLSLSVIGLGALAGMAFVFIYNLIRYLGAWNLTFLTFISSLLVPALFAGLIFIQTQNNGKHIFFAVPFALKALTSLINVFRVMFSSNSFSTQSWLINLSHIALAVLFILAILGKFKGFGKFTGKKVMMILSGGAAVVIGIMALNSGLMSAVVQLAYFGAVCALIYESNLDMSNSDKK